MRAWTLTAILLAPLWLAAGLPAARAESSPPIPPRLSLLDGQVSFWRSGAEEWTVAQQNIPLAPGDRLSTGSSGSLEIQIGGRSYARAWAETQLGLDAIEPDYLRLALTAGHLALDIRQLDPAHTVAVATPHAAFSIEQPGYYRIDVTADRTSFVTRRGGRAMLAPANGPASPIGASEQVVVQGPPAATVTAAVAPELDEWDRWNYARTEALVAGPSSRYVAPEVYGASDLDRYGTWRVAETYGPLWVPAGGPAGWVPYSSGRWISDPTYGWTWVDSAPWGWAPFHYGRWVFVNGLWAWAPGPVVAAPAYAPALVAFFDDGPGIPVASPAVGWVALCWGEPVIPWWGPPGFAGIPWWAGWGGPRIVNNVVVNRTTIVNIQNITVYRNASVHNAVVAVPRERFGRSPVSRVRLAHADVRALAPLRGPLNIAPGRASLAPESAHGLTPPGDRRRPVTATRSPGEPTLERPARGSGTLDAPPGPHPRRDEPAAREAREVPAARPAVGASPVDRPRPPLPSWPVTPGARPQERDHAVLPPARPTVAPIPLERPRPPASPSLPVARGLDGLTPRGPEPGRSRVTPAPMAPPARTVAPERRSPSPAAPLRVEPPRERAERAPAPAGLTAPPARLAPRAGSRAIREEPESRARRDRAEPGGGWVAPSRDSAAPHGPGRPGRREDSR